jgi:hypothetical protein
MLQVSFEALFYSLTLLAKFIPRTNGNCLFHGTNTLSKFVWRDWGKTQKPLVRTSNWMPAKLKSAVLPAEFTASWKFLSLVKEHLLPLFQMCCRQAILLALVLVAFYAATEARYLPTRSQDDRLDRLRELLRDVSNASIRFPGAEVKNDGAIPPFPHTSSIN